MTVPEATPIAAPPVPGQEEKSWDAQYELPEEFKRWYDQLFDNVLLYHFKEDASATQRTDKFARKLYSGEVLRRRGYDREVLLNEKWRLIKTITRDLEIIGNPVLYRRKVARRLRLFEFIWQFFAGIISLVNIYYAIYGFPVFESLFVALSVAIFIAVSTASSIRLVFNNNIEKKLSQAPEQQKIISYRLALIKERWGGF